MTVPHEPQDCFASDAELDEPAAPGSAGEAGGLRAAAVPGAPAVLDEDAVPDEDDERWVAFVRADDTTGTIAALAAVFATRGVSIGSLATGRQRGAPGLVVVTFRTGERRQRLLARTVERLPMVGGVVVRRADDLGVRAAAVVHLPAGTAFAPAEDAAVRWSGDAVAGEPLLVEGALVDVETVVAAARAAGATADALLVQPPA